VITNDLVDNFIISCKNIIIESTDFSVVNAFVFEEPSNFLCSEVAIFIGVGGSVKGQAIISMSKSSAIKVAQSLFEELEIKEFDEIARCSISEFGNIVIGNAIQAFAHSEQYVDITPPAIATGTNLEMHMDKMRVIGTKFILDKNEPFEIIISICIKEK